MSDRWFSERMKMSVERWANCPKKEFAHRSKRSLNLKERAFWAGRSLSDVSMISFCLRGLFFFTIVKNNTLHLLLVRPPSPGWGMGWFSKKISLPLSLINTYHMNLILARPISEDIIFKKNVNFFIIFWQIGVSMSAKSGNSVTLSYSVKNDGVTRQSGYSVT
jgi:hypothetical protein